MPETDNLKKTILKRMRKTAQDLWDVKDVDELDPVISRIMEALSTELSILGQDIKTSQKGILEKVANLLTPGFLTCPQPAHALMHANPVEKEDTLSCDFHFSFQKEVPVKEKEKVDTTVYFTPVDTTWIFKGDISMIASGDFLYSYENRFDKKKIAQVKKGQEPEDRVIWIGLSVDEELTDINKLCFYFEWKDLNNEKNNLNYQLLALSKWWLGDNEISISPGISFEDSTGNLPAGNEFIENDVLTIIENNIKRYYNSKFITITEPFKNISKIKKVYPESFSTLFEQNDLLKQTEKLLWLKISFPTAIQKKALDEVNVYTNCFPVMNRELKEILPNPQKSNNIIPLRTEEREQFLSVRSLYDNNSELPYTLTTFNSQQKEKKGTYVLRSGGLERFDGRTAKELVNYMIEILRSESDAFSSYGKSYLNTTLSEISKYNKTIEDEAQSLFSREGEIPNYIIVKPYNTESRMHTKFWVTLSQLVNDFKPVLPGEIMQAGAKTAKADSLFFVTKSIGGKNRLGPDEKVSAFRYNFMTRNRIVTAEDIRNLCLYQFGNRIDRKNKNAIIVNRGIMIANEEKQSFRRTIDITITEEPSGTTTREEWDVLLNQLEAHLRQHSGMSNHYRIFLKKPEIIKSPGRNN